MSGMSGRRAAAPFFFFGKNDYSKFATVDGAPLSLPQIDAENLLKAADDLTNATYWTKNTVTVTPGSDGWFTILSTIGGSSYIVQDLTNWFPKWAGTVSLVFEIKAATDTSTSFGFMVDGSWIHSSKEIISGPGSLSGTGLITVSGLTSEPTRVRLTGTAKGWATSAKLYLYAAGAAAAAGEGVTCRLFQVILGDQPSEKPRPVGAGADDWMMAYRPHNRLTGDGNGRYSVVDTAGLVSVGECADIRVSQGTATGISCPSDFSLSLSLTIEDGNFYYFYPRYTDVDNCLKLMVLSSRRVSLRNEVNNVSTTLFESDPLTDGVFYRFRLEAQGSDYWLYIDDALVASGQISDASNNLNTGGYVYTSLVTNDSKIVTESYPRKATGIIIAGGEATPNYGDPGVAITSPTGGYLTGWGQGTALLLTLANFGGGAGRHGMSTSKITTASAPGLGLGTSNVAIYNTGGSTTVVNDAYTLGQQNSFLQMYRASSSPTLTQRGVVWFRHEEGKQWRRWWVDDNNAALYQGYIFFGNYNNQLYITRVALLDLSTVHEAEWCEVLDTRTVPVSTTVDFDVASPAESGRHFELEFTCHSGYQTTVYARYVDENNYLYFRCKDSRAAQIISYVDGEVNVIKSVSTVFTHGVAYKIDFVDDGENIQMFIDGVLWYSGTYTPHADEQTVRVTNDSPTYTPTLTTHPHPALGGALGATDRVVCPQGGDTADALSDLMMIVRGVDVPAVSSGFQFFRGVAHDASPYCASLEIVSGGTIYVKEYPGGVSTARIVAALGSVVDDDDVMVTADGANAAVYVNGASKGTTSAMSLTTNTGSKNYLPAPVVADSTEFWPLYVNLPFKL